MVEFESQHGVGRKRGTDETSFLPTAVNSDLKRGSLLLNDHECERINLHLETMVSDGTLPFQCSFMRLDKSILDLIKVDDPPKKDQGAPSKCNADIKYIYNVLSELEPLICTRLGNASEDTWPPLVTHCEYAKYKLALGSREVPKSISTIKSTIKNYQSAQKVIADVYFLFECDFIYFVPGSRFYLNRVENLAWFHKKLDEYTYKGSAVQLDPHLLDDSRRSGSGGGVSTPTTKRLRARASADLCTQQSSDDEGIITAKDHKVMNRLLAQLTEEDHGKLYEDFKNVAQWLICEDAVELDDRNTTLTVFRQMTEWCENRLSIRTR
eukprot:GHVH01003580.1.p1 GENE.GHVH01003580.1~~GHVH01003580.1.p1  ORF type:complete len:324 (+),score=43.43 GHVH01003580.1:89-1060(+)